MVYDAIFHLKILVEKPIKAYNVLMDEGIIINESALKHGYTRADIEWAFLHPICNGILSEYDNKYLLVGFDTKGNPIEIIYNRIDEEQINVFHTMKCRKDYLPKDKHFCL